MSYILDALRKADAQRERDPARGIHALGVTAWPAGRLASPASRLWLWGLALLAVAALLAAAAWWLARPSAPLVAAPMAASPSDALAPAALPGPAVRAPVPANEVLPAAPPAPPPAPALVPIPIPIPSPLTAVPREPQAPASPLATTPALPAAAAPDRLLSINELPADIQRELPKLTITGGVYSTNAAQRLLIVNGQVLNEGAEAAPGVQLAQIRPKTAVLVYRGYRYGVAY